MKIKVTVVILALLAVGLAIGLIKTNQDASVQEKKDQADIASLSNGWSQTSAELADQKQTNLRLDKDLSDRNAHIEQLSGLHECFAWRGSLRRIARHGDAFENEK